MNIDFRFRTAAAYSKASPHLLALAEIEEEEDKALWAAKKPVTEVHAAADAVVQEQVVDAATREILTQTTAPLELLGITNDAPAPEVASDPLSSLLPTAAPADAPAASSTASEPAPASTPAGDPLASLLPTAAPVATEFVVFNADGTRRAGYAHQADALKVYQHDLEQTTDSAELEALVKANGPLWAQMDRSGKASMTKAYNTRKDHLAAVAAALAGEAPAGTEHPAMTNDEFFVKFAALAAKTGPQAVTEIYTQIGCTSYKDMAAEHYHRALDLLQQVIDNKGK